MLKDLKILKLSALKMALEVENADTHTIAISSSSIASKIWFLVLTPSKQIEL